MLRSCLVIALLSACSSAGSPPEEHPDAAPNGSGSATPDAASPDSGPTARFLCRTTPPANAPQPDHPALPAAGCPTLVPGMNTITTSGNQRQFILVTPAQSDPGEKLPILFMWHWIGGTANGFLEKGEVQAASDDQHFIAVIPVARAPR